MKRTILFTLLVFFNLTFIVAQDKKFMIGGNLGLQYSSTMFMSGLSSSTVVSSMGTSFGPLFGYHINEKIVIGTELGLNWTRSVYGDYAFTADPPNYSLSRGITVSPFVRKYFENSLFLHGGLIVGRNFMESIQLHQSITQDYKQIHNSFGLGVGLGYSFSLCERVKFEPLIKYTLIRHNGQNDQSTDFLKSDFNFSVGFTYHF